MGEYHSTTRETVRVLAALSDENRFRIVEMLADQSESVSCGAIGKALDISPSLLSHHLGILADAGIIARHKNGLWTMNVLQRSVIEEQLETLQALIGNGEAEPPTRVIPLRSPDNVSGTSAPPTPPLAGDTGDGALAES